MSRIFLWLDASPARYATAAWGVFALVVAVAMATYFSPSSKRRWWRRTWLFPALMGLTLLAFRWPILLNNRQLLDPDESQLMAGAITLRQDPLFWRSVDGTTHGPIDDWVLMAPLFGGGRLDFTAARTTSVVLAWVALLAAWRLFRHLFDARLAGVLVLPILAAQAFTTSTSFVQYSSEHAPAALLALGCSALLLAWNRDGGSPRPGWLCLAGLALGAVPFAKLQGFPPAAWATGAAIVALLLTPGLGGRERVRAIGSLLLGVLALPAALLGWIAVRGIWTDFWSSYILNNLQYAGSRWFSWAETPAKFFELGSDTQGFHAFFLSVSAFACAGLFFVRRFSAWHRRCALFAATLSLAAIYAAMAPGRMFPHYLHLLFFPVGIFAGIAAGGAIWAFADPSGGSGSRALSTSLLAGYLLLGLVPQIRWRAAEGQPEAGVFTRERGALAVSATSREILRYAKPGQRMAMWGWMPTFWIETGLIQGTRDGNTWRQLEAFPDRDHYRRRYLEDFQRNQPPVFIDAVGGQNFGYQDRATVGHETFPALHDWVAKNYRRVADIDGTRIYVLLPRP